MVAVVNNGRFDVGPALCRALAVRGHDIVVGDPTDEPVAELELLGVAAEVARHGVQVSAAGTNFVDFPEFLAASGANDPAVWAKLEAQVPLGRPGTWTSTPPSPCPSPTAAAASPPANSSLTPEVGDDDRRCRRASAARLAATARGQRSARQSATWRRSEKS